MLEFFEVSYSVLYSSTRDSTGNPVFYPDGSMGYAFESNNFMNYGSSPMSRGPSIGGYQNDDDHISRLLRQRARPSEESRQAALREKQQASVR